jgi:hypothetical protein
MSEIAVSNTSIQPSSSNLVDRLDPSQYIPLSGDMDYRWVRGMLDGEVDWKNIKQYSNDGWEVIPLQEFPQIMLKSHHKDYIVFYELVLCRKPKPPFYDASVNAVASIESSEIPSLPHSNSSISLVAV